MTVRKHHTKDQSADTTPLDDFDALLQASSLGAPHVLAETDPLPSAVRSRLDQAAATHPQHIAALPDNDTVAGADDAATYSTDEPDSTHGQHRSPTRSHGRPAKPQTKATAATRRLLPVLLVCDGSASDSASGAAHRTLREHLHDLMDRMPQARLHSPVSDERPRSTWIDMLLGERLPETGTAFALTMFGRLSCGKSLPDTRRFLPVTPAEWMPDLRLRADEPAIHDGVETLWEWRQTDGVATRPGHCSAAPNSHTGRLRGLPGSPFLLLPGLPWRLPGPDGSETSPHSLAASLLALSDYEPEDARRPPAPWAHPTPAETVARELGYLTLHLWGASCDGQTDRAHRSPGPRTPTCLRRRAAPPGSRLLRLLPESSYGGTADELSVSIWNGIRDAMERVSALLLQDRRRNTPQPPPDKTGLPNCGVETRPPASSDLAPLWRALADCWATQHTTMPLRLHTDEYDTGRVLPARFTYRRMDPYAIEVVFRPHSPRAKSWVFARDLLLDGLHRSTGEGDVIVWPRPGPSSSNCSTFIRLKTPQGTALLSASQTDLESYLEQTQQAVPSGAEHQHMSDALNNLERELAALTSGAVG